MDPAQGLNTPISIHAAIEVACGHGTALVCEHVGGGVAALEQFWR